jgi:hypothetical protein
MNFKTSFQNLKKRLSSFTVEQVTSGTHSFDFNLTEEELEKDLIDHSGTNRLLERFTESEVVAALKNYSVWKKLADKGFTDPSLVIRSIDPFRQAVKILDSSGSKENEDHILCELRVFDAHLKGPCPISDEIFEIDALVIDWLVFQNPRAQFTPSRPRLPGQKYPGLGIMRPCMTAILDLARETGKQAVVNIPEYYHNAVLYQPAFRFFSPFVEGRFRALQKFLKKLNLAEASHAVASGKIWNQTKNEPFVWKPHEQILGLDRRISEYVKSEAYLQKAKEAEEASKFAWHGSVVNEKAD